MHKNKDQLYELIKDLKTRNIFEEEIKKRQKEYDDLLDEDTIALLIVDELGRNKQTISKIADLKPGLEHTVIGKITDIGESRTFTRKNGNQGSVVNLEITDSTGTCKLVLWNKDVELVTNKTIKKGTTVKIINGYIKDGFNGLEVNVGRWGLIEIEPGDTPVIEEEKTVDSKIIKGTIFEIEPTNAFFRDNMEFGFVTKIQIKDPEGLKQLTLWDEKVKEIQRFKKGDIVVIENVDIRQKNNTTEYHLNGRSNIKKS